MCAWFTTTDTYERPIKDPDSGEAGTVKLKPLDWGATLRMNELKLEQAIDGGSSVKLSPGESKLLMCELALVEWSLPLPITRDTLQRLNPAVGEQIFAYVDVGGGESSPDHWTAAGYGAARPDDAPPPPGPNGRAAGGAGARPLTQAAAPAS